MQRTRRLMGPHNSIRAGHNTMDAQRDRLTATLRQDQTMLPASMVSVEQSHKAEECYQPLCLAKNAHNYILSWILAQ